MVDDRKKIWTNYTIEIEVTNYCNAKCVFCANKQLKRSRGFLRVSEFECFVNKIVGLEKNFFFRKYSGEMYPRITFCGLGEPLLHPEISQIVKIAHNAGLYTQLVTNGMLLTPPILKKLIDAGLNEMAISLHSINPNNYFAITGLQIDNLKKTLLDCKNFFAEKKLKFEIWRIKHPNPKIRDTIQDEIDFQTFIQEIGLDWCEILGPSEPWSRDGYVPTSKCEMVNDNPFWCNKIVFTVNTDWEGNLVLCCNDYNSEHINLGNVFDDSFSFQEYMTKKMDIFFKKKMPELCLNCRRWADNEILDILKSQKIDENTFFDDLQQELTYYK